MATGRIPGPIGTDPSKLDEDNRFLASKNPGYGYSLSGPLGIEAMPTKDDAGSDAPTGAASVELTFHADFPNPWKATINTEVTRMDTSKWNPSKDDFFEVAKKDASIANIFEVPTFNQFLNLIKQQAVGSIERINILTHSNANLIALQGTVDAATGDVSLNVSGGVTNPDAGGIDLDALSGLRSMYPKNLAEIKKRFRKDAEMIFYSCHAGQGAIGSLLLKEIAKTFQVTVKGFKDSIWYCPKYKTTPKPTISDRTITGFDSNCTGNKSGFKHLQTQTKETP